MPTAPTYIGDPAFDDLTGDVLQMPLNGLLAFEGEDEISIVAAPGYAADRASDAALGIQNAVISHCERKRYRVAVLETPENQTITEALDFRNLRSSDYAALYYPWINVIDPRPDQGGNRLKLPPSGFMAGIYARNDIEHAVFKAPANEVVRLAVDFEVRLNGAQQDILNPNGVNCLRFFEGRGFLVWGARTISDDPEWKYISLRRYFAYMERSIDKATQWAVFENNGPAVVGQYSPLGGRFPVQRVGGRRPVGRQAGQGLLRALRPQHHDPERPGQRPPGVPDWCRRDSPGRVRHLPHWPVDGRR